MFTISLLSLVLNFFGTQKVTNNLYILSCPSHPGLSQVQISATLSSSGFSVNFIPPNTDVEKFVDNMAKITYDLPSIGIFVDFDCSSSAVFLNAVSK